MADAISEKPCHAMISTSVESASHDDDSASSGLEEESPVFNYSNVEDENSPFLASQDDESTTPVESSEAGFIWRTSRRSVFSAMELDELEEKDFPDQGRMPEKSAADVSKIIQQIKNIVLFEGYDDDELKLVTDYMYLQPVAKDDVVIKIGSVGDAIYVIQSGRYKCVVPGISGSSITVKTYNEDGIFGELALINHAPRAATIIAVTDGELWVLNALRHAWLRKNRAMFNAERFEQVIKAIPLFRDNLNAVLTSRLIDALEVVTMSPGEVICSQGDPGDAMYFILNGEVEVQINKTPVRLMTKNEFFGERALVLYEGRAATCCAKSSVKLAKLPKESFGLLIPDSVVEQMRQHIAESYGLPTTVKNE